MRAGRRLSLAVLAIAAVHAHAASGTASGGNANAPLSASASLDFTLNIGRFLFFRVGPQEYPIASTEPAALDIVFQPTAPGAPPLPNTVGNGLPLAWNGGPPGFSPLPAVTGIPVQVRTNAGPISIRASVLHPLVSGVNSIPLSQIAVTSSDPGLPAPALPDTGTGGSVLVTGTDFGNLVTLRSATWNFSYTPAVLPPPGTYTGQISYTAVSP